MGVVLLRIVQMISCVALVSVVAPNAFGAPPDLCEDRLIAKPFQAAVVEIETLYRRFLEAKNGALFLDADLVRMIALDDPFALPADGPSERIHLFRGLSGLRDLIRRDPKLDAVLRPRLLAIAAENLLRRRLIAKNVSDHILSRTTLQRADVPLYLQPEKLRNWTSLAVMPDGRFVASDASIRGFWQNEFPTAAIIDPMGVKPTVQLELPIFTEEIQIRVVGPVHEGRHILGYDYKQAYLWETATGALRFTLKGISGVHSAVASPDGSQIAVMFGMGRIGLWNPEITEEVRGVDLCAGTDQLFAFTPDNSTLVSVRMNGVARAVDIATLAQRDLGALMRDFGSRSAISPDARLLARYVEDKQLFRVVRVSDKQTIFEIAAPYFAPGKVFNPERIVFSPDGKLFVAVGSHYFQDGLTPIRAVVAEPETGRRAFISIPGELVRGISFSADAKTMLTTGTDGWIRSWDIEKIFDGGGFWP